MQKNVSMAAVFARRAYDLQRRNAPRKEWESLLKRFGDYGRSHVPAYRFLQHEESRALVRAIQRYHCLNLSPTTAYAAYWQMAWLALCARTYAWRTDTHPHILKNFESYCQMAYSIAVAVA